MSQKELLQLPKTQFSGLEFSNILEDIYNLVRENPEYNENWDDFLSSSAGVMLTEIFAWITDQLATRIDWVVNENFIGTATQRSSIINLLKLIGYKFKLPVAAEVPVEVTFGTDVGVYILTPTYSSTTGEFNPKTLLAKDKKGNLKYFEAVQFDTVTGKYLYDLPIELNTSETRVFNVSFYEGQTQIENFQSVTNQGQVFTLSEDSVIRDSVVVTLVSIDGGTGEVTEEILLEVDSFLDLKAQQETNSDGSTNAIPYVLNVLEDDAVEVTFGSSSLLANQSRRLKEGDSIRTFYRIGGGLDGNISRGAIDVQEDIKNFGIPTEVTYYNKTEGVGSEDSESIEHAAYVGPLQIKTAGKTVTEEDYDIILSSFINVLLSKAYGHNNLPSNFYEKYGTFISPLEVLNFVIMKKSGWEEIPTSKYKYANWGTFNLENYFNEKINFYEGDFGALLSTNITLELTDNEVYDYNNQGGREFNNFTVLSTPQNWKDNLWIENPNPEVLSPDQPYTSDVDDYIANVNAKASLTTVEYDEITHQKLEDIPGHFVANDDELDPYFYGDYNNTGLPREYLNEDIQSYMESKKDNLNGVFIGSDHLNDPNLLLLNIDEHGEVNIDLSLGGINSGSVPLEGVNGVIDVINSALSDAYNDVYAYQDFGVQIPDTGVPLENLEDKDEEIWTLRISGIDYSIDLNHSQTYDDLITYMNDAFTAAGTHGHQIFNDSAPWTVVDATQYDFDITVDGTGPTNVVLGGVTGTSLTAADLIILINDAFIFNGIDALSYINGSAVEVRSNTTGTLSSILVEAGTTDDLLAVTGAMSSAVAGTGQSGANLIATHVQSQINIACSDVRISRANPSGGVELADSGTTVDILAAYGALPITTKAVDYGDYSQVASIVDYGDGKNYIKLTSPTSGGNSTIRILKSYSGIDRDATKEAFGLDFIADDKTEYICYGRTSLTIIFRDTDEPDFGDFIYEHGSIHYNREDPTYIFLNYLTGAKDTVKLGSYYTDNFDDTDPEWRLPALRIYNTVYVDDVDDPNPLAEKIDYDLSNFVLKFSRTETIANSIYVIEEDMTIDPTTNPTVTSIDLSGYTYGTGNFIKMSINENVFQKVSLNGITDVAGFASLLNSSWSTEANEAEAADTVTFATVNGEFIILEINNRKDTGNITIYDDEDATLLGAEIFDTTAGENEVIYPAGDYYLEHFRPQFDSEPALTPEEVELLTPEELFGYFNMKIITGKETDIPDLDFYVHMVNDRRHEFKDPEVYSIHTDEDDLVEVLYPYKIAGVDNSFKRPIFNTFDVKADIFVETSSSSEQVKSSVNTKLREFYSLENTVLSQDVNKSELIGLVLDVQGVRYIDITYFGLDFTSTDEESNQDLKIEVDFDEILVLSDDLYSTTGEQNHGLIFNYGTL